MLNVESEKLLARILSIGAASTTIFVLSDGVTDPVNVTKFIPLGITGFAALGVLCATKSFRLAKKFALTFALLTCFLLAGLSSVLSSASPITQGIYGAYGRNNGLYTYFFLGLILFATLALRSRKSFKLLVKGLLIAGVINLIYCMWVIVFGDFISWSNTYGNTLGTFGNPNFIGAFLGIFVSAYVGYCLDQSSPKWIKHSLIFVIPISVFEIYDTHAVQGRVVGAAGLAVVGFIYLKSRFNLKVLLAYSATAGVAGLIALLGTLQIGPLTSIIYKRSVSLRGQYWLAGWNTGESNPMTGVGMDAFGDWYRRSRDLHALELPGVDIVVNAAHNVPLDMFAFGGWPLFVSYLLIMSIGGIALSRMVIRTKQFDGVLAVLASSWVGYQLQSIISINQIGLAVWGWLLTGALISYERATRNAQSETPNLGQKVRKIDTSNPMPALTASTFALASLILVLPPFTADTKWRSAQQTGTLPALEATMESAYFNPPNTMKYLTNIQILEQNKLTELAHKYSLEAVKWNPNNFDLWKTLYLVENSTIAEKNEALLNMKRLDPLNPNLPSTK